jgi:hypothetical protein
VSRSTAQVHTKRAVTAVLLPHAPTLTHTHTHTPTHPISSTTTLGPVPGTLENRAPIDQASGSPSMSHLNGRWSWHRVV